jgi:hypothetical protein
MVVGESNVALPAFVLSADFKRNTTAYRQQEESEKTGLASDRWA